MHMGKSKNPGRNTLYDLYVVQHADVGRMAEAYGVTPDCVRHWLWKAGIRRRTEDVKGKEKELYEDLYIRQDMTCREAAEHLGVSRQALMGRMNRLGIRKRMPPELPDEVLEDMYVRRGMTAGQVAESVGLTGRQVRRHLQKAGIRKEEPCGKGGKRARKCPGKEALEEMARSGMGKAEIAEACGALPSSVQQWLTKYGIRLKYNKNPGRDELERMFLREHMTKAEIAEACGVSATAVSRWLKLDGLAPVSQKTGGKLRPADAELAAMLKGSRKTQEIAAEWRVSAATVRRWIKEAGLTAKKGEERKDAKG